MKNLFSIWLSLFVAISYSSNSYKQEIVSTHKKTFPNKKVLILDEEIVPKKQ